MSLSVSQWMSIDDNSTTYDVNVTDEITTAINIISTTFNNNSCYPTCYLLVKPTSVNENFITTLICSLAVALALVIVVGIVVFSHYHLHSQNKDKELLQDDKLCAHPFEEILVITDDSKSIELMEIRPTTVAN